MVDRPKLWKAVQEAWALPQWYGRKRIAAILNIRGKKRFEMVTLAGLDRPQKEEAFWARLAQMRKAK